jgi:hypothetical protein
MPEVKIKDTRYGPYDHPWWLRVIEWLGWR